MKRFVDTDLWKKQWFMELTPAEKIAWLYITSECDNVGVWSPNYRLAEFIIGTQLDWEKFRLKCNNNIIIIQSGKWWLIDFIKFQYGELKETCKPHLSYIKLLKAHGLFKIYNQTHSIGYPYPMDTLKDQYKDKDQDQDKDQDKEIKEKKTKTAFKPPTVLDVKTYCDERKNGIDPEYFVDHYISNGWMVGKGKMKDWKGCIRTWEKNNFNTRNNATNTDYDDIKKSMYKGMGE